MQGGKVKHWNQSKGYGFIEPDDKSEDVFFHISSWQLPNQPMTGQQVYFNSERNNKKQLRASKVSAEPGNSAPSSLNHATKPALSKKRKASWVSSVVAIIAIVYFGFSEIKTSLFHDDIQSTSSSSNSSLQTNKINIPAITGDKQLDRTISLIQQGGPFPYPHKDGTTFGNREGRLPKQNRGYYREYTVPTPGVNHRGARRIVTGGNPPKVYYFTADHYDSFTKLDVERK